MPIVNALRFDAAQGAILSDEEYWHRRRRRTFFSENLHNIVPQEISDKTGLIAVLGSAGSPTFFLEVVRETQARMTACLTDDDEAKTTLPATLEEVGKIVIEELHKALKRRLENVIRIYFGFGLDDLNQGAFQLNGETIEIAQELVKKEAKEVASGKCKVSFISDLMDSRGVLFGYDRKKGVFCYYVNVKEGVLSVTSGGFEAIGNGKYASGITFAEYLNGKILDERRGGFDRVEGMITLIKSGLAAANYFSEVGGALNIIFIDGEAAAPAERYREIPYHVTTLAAEIVTALEYGVLDYEKAYELIESLMFGGASETDVEQALFADVPDADRLQMLLEGYKLDQFEALGRKPLMHTGEEATQ